MPRLGFIRKILRKVRDILNKATELGLMKTKGSGVVKDGTEFERPADLRDRRQV